MSHPERPRFQSQDPNHGGSCRLDGRECGWLNCTPTATAMAVEKATLGKTRVSGCQIRILTGDRSGGTMLSQCGDAARKYYGVDSVVRVGSNYIDTDDLKDRLLHGHGAVVQGNAIALVGTKHQSTRGAVNHAVYVNEVYSGKALVFDPARSDRRASWGKVTEGPEWWSWDLLVQFAAKLRPWGDADSRILGRGRAYAAIYPDTEPHVHLRFTGSHGTNPLPRDFIVKSPVPRERVNVRSGPSRKYDVIKTKPNGSTFTAWQRTDKGQALNGSRTWWGNHTGNRWVHDSGLENA